MFGQFQEWNGISLGGAARNAGGAWERMGAGLEGGVRSAVQASDGSIYAAGQIGGDRSLARWTGSTWVQIDGGSGPNGTLQDLAARPTGEVVGVGRLTSLPHNVVREYAASTVVDLANTFDGSVQTLAVGSDGSVVVGGSFSATPDGGAPGIARFAGEAWSALPFVSPVAVDVVATQDGRTVYGGGFYAQNSTQRAHAIYRMLDGQRTEIGGTVISLSGAAFSDMLVASDGALLVTGSFSYLFTASGSGVARYDGAWSIVGGSMNDVTHAVTEATDGTLYVVSGKGFGAQPYQLRRWDGSAWESLGEVSGAELRDVHAGPDGAVYVAGTFTAAGGVEARNVARWADGVWSALGDGVRTTVWALATDADGAITACGGDGVSRWNGAVWIPEATIDPGRQVRTCAYAPSGDLVFGGDFTTVNGVSAPAVARLNALGAVDAEPAPGSDALALVLAPNPTSGSATAFVSGARTAGTLSLYDVTGRRLAQIPVAPALSRAAVTVPTARLAPGVYLVQLVSGATVETRRLVIAR